VLVVVAHVVSNTAKVQSLKLSRKAKKKSTVIKYPSQKEKRLKTPKKAVKIDTDKIKAVASAQAVKE
jgi:hypothetical protein